MHNSAKNMALCGVLAALALVFMCMGTLIPLATFVCPMLCMIVLSLVCRHAGKRMGWAWYICVSVLSLLLAPDKEAAVCLVFLGYYPIVKPFLERGRFSALWKLLLFNAGIGAMYVTLIYVFGMEQVLQEFAEMGKLVGVFTLVLGNICLFFFDFLLNRLGKMK